MPSGHFHEERDKKTHTKKTNYWTHLFPNVALCAFDSKAKERKQQHKALGKTTKITIIVAQSTIAAIAVSYILLRYDHPIAGC